MRTSMIGRALQKIGGMMRGRSRRPATAGVGARRTSTATRGGGIGGMIRRFLR